MYSASGKPMQSKNASGIYSCADYTQRDKLKALAWNSTYSNIASDNFENNYLFGTHQYSNSEKHKISLVIMIPQLFANFTLLGTYG